jgi:hypothetical protein
MVLHFTDDGIEEYLYTKRGRKELIEALKAAAEPEDAEDDDSE